MKKHNCQKSCKIISFKKGDDYGTMLFLLFLSSKNFSSKCCFQMKNCSSWREQGNCITTLRVVGVYSDNCFRIHYHHFFHFSQKIIKEFSCMQMRFLLEDQVEIFSNSVQLCPSPQCSANFEQR